ncbi:Rieske 2Fe-2S domain-containing protein [Flavihumibacter sp. CACIAM 22H1]|uniref:Rieske (2Fe-2S) protein n=1 Tax=Flavihumibacter sp. CACIAM 22H1 TaxID=1812911 RepID=UPI0007A8DEA7|nr:Rieske 2Fe-2S domain-containing protein [Flavihumibacter sp. CACIAM 22H1]KYP13888.1 MAG: hypothetical protein A1D16_20725 [Flavihumibacter sp. CACIAM 22H1]
MEYQRLYNWVKLAGAASELEFGPNQIALAAWDGRPICIGRYKNRLFAFAYKCPHASGLLSDGFIDALGNVVCPLHRYRFSISTGHNVSGEGYRLRHWPVEERPDGLYLGLPFTGPAPPDL